MPSSHPAPPPCHWFSRLAAVLDPIRERLDPISAGRVGAHITVTPPFAEAPSSADEERVVSTVRDVAAMEL